MDGNRIESFVRALEYNGYKLISENQVKTDRRNTNKYEKKELLMLLFEESLGEKELLLKIAGIKHEFNK